MEHTEDVNKAAGGQSRAGEAGANLTDVLERWIQLGVQGFTISICYGPCGNSGLLFSVNVMTPDLQEFSKPFGARTLEQAVEIAEIEIRERGWNAASPPEAPARTLEFLVWTNE